MCLECGCRGICKLHSAVWFWITDSDTFISHDWDIFVNNFVFTDRPLYKCVRFVKTCKFVSDINTCGFGITYNSTFSILINKALSHIIGNHIILQLYPLRSTIDFCSKHIIEHISELFWITLSKPIFIVLQCLPMNPRVFVSVAFILVLKKTTLENNHTQGENIAFVWIDVGRRD